MYHPYLNTIGRIGRYRTKLTQETIYSASQIGNYCSKTGRLTMQEAHIVLKRVEPASDKYRFGRFNPIFDSSRSLLVSVITAIVWVP